MTTAMPRIGWLVLFAAGCSAASTSDSKTTSSHLGTGAIGNDGAGGNIDNLPANDAVWFKFGAASAATLDTMHVAIASASCGNLQLGVYADAAGYPGALLGATGTVQSPGTGWQAFPLNAAVTVASGTSYWLAVFTDTNCQFDYTADTGTPSTELYTWSLAGLPSAAPPDMATDATAWYRIYADGAGSAPPPPQDPCAGITCSGHGRCAATNGAATCACDPGFHASGTTCVANASGGRKWYENPGGDGSFWVLPMQTGAVSHWIRSGAMIDNLRNGQFGSPNGRIRTGSDYVVPWVIGTASDPLVTVVDASNGHAIHVRVPAGTPAENAAPPSDNSLGGADSTQPYLVWTCNNAVIDGSTANAVHDGSTIQCDYLGVFDGSGPIMMDAYTGMGWQTSDNAIGQIQDLELTYARNDPSYVIQHMLAISVDYVQLAPPSTAPMWPGAVEEPGGSGLVPEGALIGIPADVPMPAGLSRGAQLLWTNAQQFGWFNYNANGGGNLEMECRSTDPANAALVADLVNSINEIMPYLCILDGQTDVTNMKGMVGGARSDAFPAPPLLDYAQTGGAKVAPSSFGAWYGYGVNASAPSIFFDKTW